MDKKYQITHWLHENYIICFNYECICKLCSQPLFLHETGIEHFSKEHKEWFEFLWLTYERTVKKKHEEKTYRIRKKIEKPKYRVHIKPWKNPNSLFCDSEFLEELTGKKLLEGDECR